MFSGLLQKMVDHLDGARAAAIMGLDGIVVESASRQELLELELRAAEYSTLLHNSMRTASDTGLGDLQEMVIVTDQETLLIRLLNPSYFILLALDPATNLGRARFELRKAQLMLEPDFTL